jgi:hypothetical protein
MLTFLDKYVKGDGTAAPTAGAATHASQASH